MRRRWVGAAFACAVWLGACLDFDAAETRCVELQRCEGPLDGAVPADAGNGSDGGDSADAGDGGDSTDAGGPPGCDGGFTLVGQVCSPGGWCWENPWPTGADLNAVHGAGDTVYVAGGAGTLLRQRGCELEQLQLGTTEDFVAVAAVSEDEAWAVGPNGAVFQYRDGPVEFAYPSGLWVSSVAPFDGGVVAASSVAGAELRSYPGGGKQGVVLQQVVFGVRRLQPDRAQGFWVLDVAGQGWHSATPAGPFVQVPDDAGVDFRDLWVAPSGTAYVSGDGAQLWRSVSAQAFEQAAPADAFDAGQGTEDDVATLTAIGGFSEQLYVATHHGRLFHFDGSGWQVVQPVDALGTSFSRTLNDLWVSPEGAVFAVGPSGTLVNNLDGWRELHRTARDTRRADLEAIDGTSGELWAVGNGSIALCRRDEPVWRECNPLPKAVARAYAAVAVLAPGHVIAGGEAAIAELADGGWTLAGFTQLDGGAVGPAPGAGFFIRAITRSGTGELWAAGDLDGRGLLLRRAPGDAWREVIFVPSPVNDLAVGPDGHVWLAGNDGLLAEYDPNLGTLASRHSGGERFFAVHVSGDGTVYAGGFNYVRRFNLQNPSLDHVEVLPNQQVNDILERAGVVWMIGASGTLWNYSGISPTVVEQAIDSHLLDAYVAKDGTVWISGERGAVIRNDAP